MLAIDQGSTYSRIFTCLNSKILHVFIKFIYDSEENFAKIHLFNFQFYFQWAAGITMIS